MSAARRCWARGYNRDAMMPEVQLAVAALTVLPTCQLKGYALLMY
jgi:hypothetical protein